MTVGSIVLIVILATVAGSFSWGMRGSIIGGEKGAILPGAALGLIFAFACNSLPVNLLFVIPATVGGAAMFFGGAHTYGETIGLSYEKDKKLRHKGRIGLFIKGANWFGIFGGLIGLCFPMMAGRFKLSEIILFVILIPIVKWLGFFLLNFPQRAEQNKFPKIYFSKKRFEIWGGMLLLCVYIALFSAFKKEWFAVIMTLVGFLSGGLGFFVGNLFQTATSPEREDGKYIFGKLQKNGFINSWKLMEFTLGTVGALGTSLCFCLSYNRFVSVYVSEIARHGGIVPLMTGKNYNLLTFVWLFTLLLYTLRFVIAKSDYKNTSKFAGFIYGMEEYIIWPVFCYIPLFLSFSGNVFACEIYSFFLVFWLISDEVIFDDKYKDKKVSTVLGTLLAVLTLASLAIQLFTLYKFTALQTFLMYLLSYELTQVYLEFNPLKMSELIKDNGTFKKALVATKSGLIVRCYSLICVATMIIIGCFYFN